MKMNNYILFGRLLATLPLHAEEDNIREDLTESELVSRVQAGSDDSIMAETLVAIIRRLFECLALLDPSALAAGRWTFVSFPASLMARSVIATLATPGNTFFEPDYWIQGRHRPYEIEEQQRELLRRLENQRTSNPDIEVLPIRTVHVVWGIIRLGSKFLLHRREDRSRPDVGGYVFPGGRLDLNDLPLESRSPAALRDLFCIDSVMAKNAQGQTIARELREELKLFPSEYVATYQRTLNPFRKVEGSRNNHVYTQYDIAIYSVQLSQAGELKVLDRAAHEPTEWAWFTALELMSGKRLDGKRAFVDALMQEAPLVIEKYLSDDIPDSSTPPFYRTKGEAIALPSTVGEPLLRGDVGRKKTVQLSLDQRGWELLMLLGWHTRGLEVKPRKEQVLTLGGGWIKLSDKVLMETARRLTRQLETYDLRLVECDSLGYCRLSIDAEHLYFQPACFEYFWDIESDNKPIVLKLKEIETKWATLIGRELLVPLSPTTMKAMPAIEKGRKPEVNIETFDREIRRVIKPTKLLGLHQFISKMNDDDYEILVQNVSAHSD